MSKKRTRIGIVAPASRLERSTAERVTALAASAYGDRVELHFHPQCFLSAGHFAGKDDERARAFLEVANDPGFDALWIGRGGYGSGRIADRVIPSLTEVARKKSYLGYSDAGALFGAMYRHKIGRISHGPMPSDMARRNGDLAVKRALAYLIDRPPETMEPSVGQRVPTAAFNITILAHLMGTPYEPDLSGHVVMLEEVSEHMYRIDRALLQITSNPAMRRAAGFRLGRCSAIPSNEPDFGASEEDVVKHWCEVSGIPYLGRADIGHDVENKIVPFGLPKA